MNERIKSLIQQAEYQAKKQSGYEDWEVYVPPDSQVVFEKFAELIVKECADIALEQKKWVEDMVVLLPQHVEFNRVRIQQSQRIVDKIKQHFGVKE